jgi:hypothetical protein
MSPSLFFRCCCFFAHYVIAKKRERMRTQSGVSHIISVCARLGKSKRSFRQRFPLVAFKRSGIVSFEINAANCSSAKRLFQIRLPQKLDMLRFWRKSVSTRSSYAKIGFDRTRILTLFI